MDVEPAPKKIRTSDSNSFEAETNIVGLTTACYSHIGRRSSLEDVHIILEDAELKQQFSFIPSDCRIGLYAILDGHGGRAISEMVAHILPGHIMTSLNRTGKFKTGNKAVTKALEISFQLTENEINQLEESENCGCCAVVALVVNNIVHIANLGDSKAVMCRQLRTTLSEEDILKKNTLSNVDVSGNTSSSSRHSFPWNRGECPPPPLAESIALTVDHRPSLPSEKTRIVTCGGIVEEERIYAPVDVASGTRQSIGVARSFGDRKMKRYGVIAEPDLRIKFNICAEKSSESQNSPEDHPVIEFIILACDGLWERYSEVSAMSFVRTRLFAGTSWCGGIEHRWDVERICKALAEDAVYEKGCQDNVSILLIHFNSKREK